MFKIINLVKIISKTVVKCIIRFFGNLYARVYFALYGYYLHKPLIVKNCKYISFNGRGTILKGARIEFYKSDFAEPMFNLGNKVLIGYNCSFLITGSLDIGDNTMIASNVLITTENHGMDPSKGSYDKQPLVSRDIKIGNNVWIGEKAVILPGVTIGDNCIIGASSVVTKSVEANSIACGCPAKIIKKFNFETKEREKVADYDK